MTSSTSTALVPTAVANELVKRPGDCGGYRQMTGIRVRWGLLAAAALALAALAAGSAWLGGAAMLPFLYTLPCLLMVAMCMRGMRSGGTSGASSQ
jgi:hypothetical protein